MLGEGKEHTNSSSGWFRDGTDLDELDLSANCTLKSIPTLLMRPQLPGTSVCYIFRFILCFSGTARSPYPGKWGTELCLLPAYLLKNSHSISAALCPIHDDGNQYYLDPYRLVFEINHFFTTSQTTPKHKSSFPFGTASLEDISLRTARNVMNNFSLHCHSLPDLVYLI